MQCVQDQGCDFSNLQVLFSGDIGGYTTTFLARRRMNLDGGVQVDCAALQNCILVSLDITDLSTGAQTAIGFDPNAPFPPPLRFRIAPDATGRVQVAKGVARVTGSVRFSVVFRPFNGLFGEGTAKVRISAFGSTSSNYDLQKHAQITLVPSN